MKDLRDEPPSGDEYDSGEEVRRTADDDDFIDRNDDQADILAEYEAEGQNFDDDRPTGYKKSKKATSSSSSSREGHGPKSDDVLSKTLELIKKKKEEKMTDTQKTQYVTRLIEKMHSAALKDDNLFKSNEPAVYKLQMLKTVQQVVAVKELHEAILDNDILYVFNDWIEPKDDSTLPALTIRTAVYDMLALLPCQIDHLKRAPEGKLPIGNTIVKLRKHKMETVDNKRKLKELMEKWSRLVFAKATNFDKPDKSSSSSSSKDIPQAKIRSSDELRELALQRQTLKENKYREEMQRIDNRDTSFESVLEGNSKSTKDIYNRARTPYSNGYVFHFVPSAPRAKDDTQFKVSSGSRDSLKKKLISERQKTRTSNLGKKDNAKGEDLIMNGRYEVNPKQPKTAKERASSKS